MPTAFHNKPSPTFDKKWPNLSKSRKLKDVKHMLWRWDFQPLRTIHRYFPRLLGEYQHPQMWRCWMSSMANTIAKKRKTNFQYKLVILGGWPTIRVLTVLFKKQPASAPTVHWGGKKSPSCKKRSQPGPRFLRWSTIHFLGFFLEASCCNPAGPAPTTHTCLAKMSVFHTNTFGLRYDVNVFRISGSAKFPLS